MSNSHVTSVRLVPISGFNFAPPFPAYTTCSHKDAHVCSNHVGTRCKNNAASQPNPKLTSVVFTPRAPDLTLLGGPQEETVISLLSILNRGRRGEELKLIPDQVEGFEAAVFASKKINDHPFPFNNNTGGRVEVAFGAGGDMSNSGAYSENKK